jgi:hypothetical protein
MEIKRFNEKRADEERKKAKSAETHEARESHNLMAEIFSARASERLRKARPADG